MKIVIPHSQPTLRDDIAQCLELAGEQGFATQEIQLIEGAESTVELRGASSSVWIARDTQVSEYSSLSDDSEQNVHQLVYSVAEGDVSLADHAPHAIVIGARCEGRVLDIWQHSTRAHAEVRALNVHQKALDATQHFAWFITLRALDFPVEDALTLARAMGHVSRETSQWPCCFEQFPTPVLEDETLGIRVGWKTEGQPIAFPSMVKEALGLYPVVDDVSWIERLLPLGIKTIQLRIKDPQQADLEAQVIRAIALGQQYQAHVFINDHWQLAIKHGAFGVHLGQEDIEASNLQALSQAGIALGLSTHGYYELLRIVQISPSYIALGHIFPTTTKVMPSKPQGLVRLKLYQQLIDSIPRSQGTGFPTVAIGGIDQGNAAMVWQCGVSSLAVVRAITLADDPKSVIVAFSELMRANKQVGEQG